MINILPVEEKKKIFTEYRLRLGVVIVFAITALVLSSLILILTSYMLAVSRYNSVSGELAVIESKQGSGTQEKDVNTQISSINKKVDLFLKGLEPIVADVSPDRSNGGLAGIGAGSSPSKVILGILNIKSVAVKIQGFTYDVSGKQERLVLTGFALDRDSLAQFVETLKKEPTFTSVNLPISSYVKSTNIDFSIVVTRGVKK